MKKIAYILTTYPCQSETFIQREITQLSKLGFEIVIFAACGKAREFAQKQNASVYYRPSFFSLLATWAIIYTILRHPVGLIRLTVLVAKLLLISPKEAVTVFFNFHTICFFAKTAKKLRIQNIHACFLSWPGCITMAISKLMKINFSISAHAKDIFVEHGAVNLKIQNCDFITCCNRHGLEFLKSNISDEFHNKLFLNYHGVNLQEYIHLENRKSSNIILAASRLVKKKGFDILLESVRNIIHRNPAVHLIIAGDGPEKNNLFKTSMDLGISNNVHFVGWLNQNKLMKLISNSDILVVPSIIDQDGDMDGIPNVILEAFAVGTAVVASSAGSITEITINEQTGLLVKPGDKAELSNSLIRLLQDKNLSSRLCANAYSLVKEKFDLIKNTKELANIFAGNHS